MSRLELPDNQWAELTAPEKVSERKRSQVEDAFMAIAGDGDALIELQGVDPAQMTVEQQRTAARVGSALFPRQRELSYALILAQVAEWSFEQPISRDGLLDLPSETVAALKAACEPNFPVLFPEFTPGPRDDPKAQTTGG